MLLGILAAQLIVSQLAASGTKKVLSSGQPRFFLVAFTFSALKAPHMHLVVPALGLP
jgi:hypothetical protein